MNKTYFYFKNGQKSNKTKRQELKDKNPFNPNDYIDLMKKYDVPLIYEKWFDLLKKKHNIYTIFGRYLSLMKLNDFKNYSYKDSQILNQQFLYKYQNTFPY